MTGGDETVLVVEDNPQLRQLTARQLTGLGYRVLKAENAETALRVLAVEDRIDLLFSDVVMPGAMDGMELARHVMRLRPDLGILLTSGFPAIRGPGQRICPSEFSLLGKPYRIDELGRAVREVLDRKGIQSVRRARRNVARAAVALLYDSQLITEEIV